MIASRGLVRDASRVMAATLLILIYCLIQRGPMLYGDSFAYYKIGAQATHAVHFGSKSKTVKTAVPNTAAAAEEKRQTRLSYTSARARSPYYALPVYWLISLGSIWLLAGAQALLVAIVMFVAFRNLAGRQFYLPSMAALVVFSALPVFAVLIMPDFMAVPTILAATLLVWRWPTLSRGERIFLVGVVTFGGLIHTTHKVVAVALGLSGLLLSLIGHRVPASRAGSAAVVAAAIAAMIGGILYPLTVRALIHERIYSPPFLTARVFSEGPGRDFLERVCAKDENSFAMCRFRHERVTDSNNFLWSANKFYQQADRATRVRMSVEDKKLFLGTLRQEPVVIAGTSATNSMRMLGYFGAGQVLTSQGWLLTDHDLIAHLAPTKSGCAPAEAKCMARIGPAITDLIAAAGAILGLLAIGVMMVRNCIDRHVWTPIVAFVLMALVVNAALCASFSSVVPRYQARIAWLIPAIALMMAADAIRRRRQSADTDGSAR